MTIEKRIENVCKTIYDPEIPQNIWDLGLVYSIHIDEEKNVEVVGIFHSHPSVKPLLSNCIMSS